MSKNKHLNLDDRCKIQLMLDNRESFSSIAAALLKDPTTISKEIRNHLQHHKVGAYHLPYNSCARRFSCQKSHICTECHAARKYTLCRRCSMCNSLCRDFEKENCSLLLKPPYVCNGCGKRSVCSLEKRVYNAAFAHREYRDILSESRTGLSYSEDEIRHLDEFLSPLIHQKQSPHHICATNADSLTVSERTVYRLIDARIISARNIDLPRKVRYSARKVKCHLKVDKACRLGRTFEDFTGRAAMRADKDSIDYQVNLAALQEMEDIVPMTRRERHCLRKWVHRGNEVESNPWNYMDCDGMPLNYLQAFRITFGYSSGPWDYWKGSDTELLWYELNHCFLSRDEFF